MTMRKVFWLCLGLGVLFAACNHTDGNNNHDNGTQKVDQVDLASKDILDLLSDSIDMDENRPDLYLRRAKVYMEREQVGQAMMDINRVTQLDPKNIEALLMLSDIYYLMGDEANITATLNQALSIDPYDTRPMVKLAELNLLQQNYNLAFAYIDNALKVSDYNPRAYFVRGMTYLARQDTASAVKNFMIAREQDASFFDPYHEISKIYVAQDSPYTERFLRSTVSLFPEEAVARYDLALYLQDHNYPDEALAHYDTLLMEQPGNSRLLFNKGYVYFVYLGDNDQALEYFNQALLSDPNYIDALYNKGHVLEQKGDYVQARAIYKQVLEKRPNYSLAIEGMNRVSNQFEE